MKFRPEVIMRKLQVISILTLLLSNLALAQNVVAPMANFEVHAIVTLGPTLFEGEKIRAVLTYGETGGPNIFLETIKVEMGYPQQSKVLWKEKIDVTGGLGEICPIAESWCGSIEDLRWQDGSLQYEIKTASLTYHCTVRNIESKAPESFCRMK